MPCPYPGAVLASQLQQGQLLGFLCAIRRHRAHRVEMGSKFAELRFEFGSAQAGGGVALAKGAFIAGAHAGEAVIQLGVEVIALAIRAG